MIVGSSHGGLAAFYMANRRPDAFGFAGALSPSFWVGVDDAERFPLIIPLPDRVLEGSQLLEAVKETLADASRRPKLYLDWGLVQTGGLHNESIEERATARGREMVKLLQQSMPIKSTKTSSFTKIRTVNIMNSRGRDVCRGSSSFLRITKTVH